MSSLECYAQIGSKDGRIKIVGREGVEATLSSETPSSTRYMQFLTGRGVLLRITEVCSSTLDLACAIVHGQPLSGGMSLDHHA